MRAFGAGARLAAVAFVALLAGWGLAACGASPAAASSTQAADKTASSTPAPSTSTGEVASTYTVLHPEAWQETAATPSVGQQQLPISLGRSAGAIIVSTAASGTGTLVVKDGAGHEVLSVAHAGQAFVAQLPSGYGPLLMVRGDTSECGSGGCTYWAYVYVQQKAAFVTVPLPEIAAFRYAGSHGQIVNTKVPAPGGWFGFITPNPDGIVLKSRLYDLFQHVESQQYVYAANGTPGGKWVAQDTPSVSPTTEESAPFTSAATQVEGLLQARSLNIPAEGLPLIEPAQQSTVWNTLSPLARWGPRLFADSSAPSVSQSGSNTVVSEEISGTVGTGASMVLQAYQLSAVVATVGTAFQVQSVILDPVVVPVDTAQAALAAARKAVGAHQVPGSLPTAALTVFPEALSWQISEMSTDIGRPWVSVNAVSGQVKSTAS